MKYDHSIRTFLKIIIYGQLFFISGYGTALELTVPSASWTEIGKNVAENAYDEPTQDKYRYVRKTKEEWSFNTRWSYDTEQIAVGTGPEVKPGDLVKFRLRVLSSSGSLYNNESHMLMMYVGRADFEDRRETFSTKPDFGFELGSMKIRRTLLGRKLGERFLIRRPTGPQAQDSLGDWWGEFIPFKALLVKLDNWTHSSNRPFVDNYADPQAIDAQGERLPYIKLSGKDISAEIEIIDTCKAKLFKKEATVFQAGYVINWGGGPVDTFRSSRHQWAAIEAKCANPANSIRLEAGPVYLGGQRENGASPASHQQVPASDAVYERTGTYRGNQPDYRLKNE